MCVCVCVCVCLCVCVCVYRQTDRQIETVRKTENEREGSTGRCMITFIYTDRQTDVFKNTFVSTD